MQNGFGFLKKGRVMPNNILPVVINPPGAFSGGVSTIYETYASLGAFPVTGDVNIFYIADDTEKVYRWTGAVYVEVSSAAIAWGAITGTLSSQTDLQTALNAKQATLVSGTNIKTVNGNSLVGSGNVVISASSRADASLAVASSAGFSVDMITAQNLIITMDAVFGGSGLKPAVNPTVDGQVLEITFKKGATVFQPVLDPAYFTDTGLDITLPSPLLNATINTEDDFRFKWSTTINKYKCVGFSRRYS